MTYTTTHFPNGREASEYQRAVFDSALHGDGDLVVSAAPGSGKSTTLKHVARLMLQRAPESRVAYLAFSKAIADEMRGEMPSEVTVATIHSQGNALIRERLGDCRLEQWKYSNPVRDMLADERLYPRKSKAYAEVSDAIKKLTDMAMVNLVHPGERSRLEDVAELYDIEIPKAYHAVVIGIADELLLQGKKMAEENNIISYGDMLWLPDVLDLTPAKPFDAVLVDEAQDLSKAQLELVMKLCRAGGRRVFVGDEKQAIFNFAGAAADSMEQIVKRTKAEVLPLSVTYRCPKSHVTIAQQISPDLKAPDTAIEGEVGERTPAEFLRDAKPGDMVMCRTTRPLVGACFDMLRAGKPAVIRGRDIGADLAKLATKIADAIPRYGPAEMLEAIEKYRISKEEEIRRRCKSDDDAREKIAAMTDKLDVLALFVEDNAAARSIQDVTVKIEKLFDDKPGRATVFTTMHRAKGLEADTTWILQPDLMPHPMAKTPQQKRSELFVEFVAITRAKKQMWFVGEYRRLPRSQSAA